MVFNFEIQIWHLASLCAAYTDVSLWPLLGRAFFSSSTESMIFSINLFRAGVSSNLDWT